MNHKSELYFLSLEKKTQQSKKKRHEYIIKDSKNGERNKNESSDNKDKKKYKGISIKLSKNEKKNKGRNAKTKYIKLDKNENYNNDKNQMNELNNNNNKGKNYGYYIFAMKQLDNIKDQGINYFSYDKTDTNKRVKKIIKFFIINQRGQRYKIGKLYLKREYIRHNIIEEHVKNIESRKVSNNLLNPHYYFTARYNENSMPSQIRHWTSSIYNFTKGLKAGNNFLDLYTSKLIDLFFSVKYMKRKLIWDIKLLEGFKILPNISLMKDINIIINYTSKRTNLILKRMISFTPLILTLDWVKEQIKLSFSVSKMIKQRKLDFFSGYYPKRKSYIRKLSKILLSKPLFKHTSFNLVIDLFVYNNKRYKFRMLKNISLRRSTYKYMYSMYIDSFQKIKETINRPRFFYLNLIEPKIYNYYNWVVSYYQVLLIKNRKSLFMYFCLLILQLNFIKKSKINIIKNKILNEIYNSGNKEIIVNNKNTVNILDDKDNNNDKDILYISFKRLLRKNKYSNKHSYYLSMVSNKNKKIKQYNINKILLKNIETALDIEKEDKKKGKRSILTKDKISKYIKYKNYMEELERKSNNPIDLNSLTLWNIEGMGDAYSTPTGMIVKNRGYIKRKKRFTSKSYKKKYGHVNIKKDKDTLKNKKRKIAVASFNYMKKMIKKFNLRSEEDIINFKLHKQVTDPKTRANLGLNEFMQQKYKEYYRNNEKWRKRDYKNNIKNSINNLLYLNPNNSDSPVISSNITINSNIDIINNDNENNSSNENNNNNNNNVLIKQDSLKSLNKEEYINEVYFNINDNTNINISNNVTNVSINLTKNDNNITKDISAENVNIDIESNMNILNKLFISFYLKKDNNKDYLNNQNDIFTNINNKLNNINLNSILNKIKVIPKNKNSISRIKNIKINKELSNSKVLWDNLDHSIINIISKYLKLKTKSGLNIQLYQLNSLFNEINKFKGYGNIWYILYFLSIIKKEFYNINRDVLISKDFQILPFSNNIINQTYYFNNNLENKNLNYKINNESIDINLWPSLYSNKRDEELNIKIGYNEKLFKPYYRYLIPYFILKSYYNLMSNLRLKNIIFNKNNIIRKLIDIKNNNFVIYNFLTVKILLDLLHYNYRNLLKIKSKYYYINKLRLYESKLKRLNINNWISSIRFIRKLRKTPLNYWLRYHKVASYYFNRVVQYAELDTKRQIFVPFVLYFEDILFNIYGKWVIIRLWPLKRYYLSSFILAGRVILLILWRRKRQIKKINFQKITSKLIAGIRILQIKKSYSYYINNNNPWPGLLIDKMKDEKSCRYLNYRDLEFYNNIEDRYHILSTYTLKNNQLSSYLSSLKDNYITAYINNINFIKKSKIKYNIKNYNINNLQFIYYWLRPLKNYLLKLNRSFDISGIKIRIKGRAGIRRNNLRSLYKTRFYGSLLGPRHSTTKLLKAKTISTPRIRGYLRSNIDYAIKEAKSQNGSISLKIWMSSIISTDLHELLLHLVKIKYLYNELINRYYNINPYINTIKNEFLLKPLDEDIKNSNRTKYKIKKIKKWI